MHTKVRSLLEHSCLILISFKIVVFFNTTSADIKTKSADVILGTRTAQVESSKFVLLSFDQGFQIVIPPRSPASVPELIGTPSDGILHRSDYCLLRQLKMTTILKEMRIAQL